MLAYPNDFERYVRVAIHITGLALTGTAGYNRINVFFFCNSYSLTKIFLSVSCGVWDRTKEQHLSSMDVVKGD
jgi:hypothetical protein